MRGLSKRKGFRLGDSDVINEVDTYDPAMFPNCDTQFESARATARFEAGRAIVFEIHANITMYPT